MTSSRTRVAPPSGGMPPPERVQLATGEIVALYTVASEVAARHRAEFPDEAERYGAAGLEWCIHDNQHLLNWAILEAQIPGLLERNVRWLAEVLAARDYALDRLARNLTIAGDVLAELHPAATDAAARLRAAAALLG